MNFVLSLLRGFSTLFGPLLVQFLFSLGVGFATYTGVRALVDQAEAYVWTNFAGLPSNIINLAQVMQVDTAISITFAAVGVRLTLMGVSAAGSLRRFTVKPE